jgi:hypothetical protein
MVPYFLTIGIAGGYVPPVAGMLPILTIFAIARLTPVIPDVGFP